MKRMALHGLNPEVTVTYRYPMPGALPWVGIAALVAAYDVWAEWNHKPTASNTFGHYAACPVVGPFVVGGWCGLSYHLAVSVWHAYKQTPIGG